MLAHQLREWTRVHRYFQQPPDEPVLPDVRAARDTLVHLLRSYELATQLVTHRRVVDYHAAEPVRAELAAYDAAAWTWWRDAFEPRLEAAHKKLRFACRESRDTMA